MNPINENLLKLLVVFKDLLYEDLFKILSDPNFDLKKMDYYQLSTFENIFIYNVKDLREIYTKLSSIDTNINMLTREQNFKDTRMSLSFK